ncbi:MAG: hypothetical protein WD185_01190, partial [Sneathiella sp.]
MLTYFVHRVLIMIPTLLVISILTFVIIQLPPGDYLSNHLQELKSQGESASAMAKIAFYREQYALDKSPIEQYALWMGFWPGPNGFSGLLQGNWGQS